MRLTEKTAQFKHAECRVNIKSTKEPLVMPSHLSKNHRAAEIYASKFKWPVFPCKSKIPLTKNGFKSATLNLESIYQMWQVHRYANIAVATGTVSSLLVLDFDATNTLSAWDALQNLENEFGTLPTSPHVLTPSGGVHWYFKCAEPLPSKVRIRPNIDVRCSGGYIIVPPSTGPSGNPYIWEACHHINEIPMAPAPEWLKLLLKNHRPLKGNSTNPSNFWENTLGNGVNKGIRNDLMTKLTGHLLRRYVDPFLVKMIIHSLNETCFKPPLEVTEINGLIESIAGLEIRRRKSTTQRVGGS